MNRGTYSYSLSFPRKRESSKIMNTRKDVFFIYRM